MCRCSCCLRGEAIVARALLMIEPESGKLATALVMVDSSLPFDSSFLPERTNETEKMNAVDV